MEQNKIGQRIRELRLQKGLSQEELAKYLDLSRTSVTQMESGKRNIHLEDLGKLSKALGVSVDKLLAEDYPLEKIMPVLSEEAETYAPDMRISVPVLDPHKLRTVLLYILERCAGKPNVGETVLCKLLYFCDFNYYEIYEEHLTGASYRKLPYGPVPQELQGLLGEMIRDKQLQRIKTDYHGYAQIRYLPNVKADLRQLKASELTVIDKVIDQFSDWTGLAISDYSHKDIPWEASEEGEDIDYELVFYRKPPYSTRTYEDENEQP